VGFEWSRILEPLFWIVVIASFLSVVWFFRFRRIMIRRQVSILQLLEEKLKPRDTKYTVHGYLVGFTGKYWVNRGNLIRAWVYYSTPPYHVFFYLPVIHLFRRSERMDFTLKLRELKPGGEAHLVVPGDRHVARTVSIDLAKRNRPLPESIVDVDGRRLKAYYTSQAALDKAVEIYRRLSTLEDVRRVSLSSSSQGLHVAIVPRLGNLEAFISSLLDTAESLRG